MKAKLLLATILSFLSFASFSSVKFIAEIQLGKETIKLDQTLEEDQIYTFTTNESLINIIIPKIKSDGLHNMKFKVFKRNGLDLIANGDGEILAKEAHQASLTIKDKKTKDTTLIKVTIQGTKGNK